MSANELSCGIGELADLIDYQVGAWQDFGYEVPPTPESAKVPALGERSTRAVKAGHEAIKTIDELTRQLYRLREQLVGELRQDEDLRAARVDAMLARRRQEPQPDPVLWQCAYCKTKFLPSGEPIVCPVCGPLHGPGGRRAASAAAMDVGGRQVALED